VFTFGKGGADAGFFRWLTAELSFGAVLFLYCVLPRMASIAAAQFRCDSVEYAFRQGASFGAAQGYYFDCRELWSSSSPSSSRVAVLATTGLVVYALCVPAALGATMYIRGVRPFRQRQERLEKSSTPGERSVSAVEREQAAAALEKKQDEQWRQFLSRPDKRYLYLLMGAYKYRFWYWELVEIGRKLCLTALFVWIRDAFHDEQSPVPLVMAIAITQFDMVVIASLRPFKDYELKTTTNNRNKSEELVRDSSNYMLSLLTTISLTFVLLAALLLKTKDEEANWYDAATFDVVLVGLLLTPPAVALLYNTALLCLSHVAERLHARRESNAKRRESNAKHRESNVKQQAGQRGRGAGQRGRGATPGIAELSPTTTADQVANRATNKKMKAII
jgi:hypothetical protein